MMLQNSLSFAVPAVIAICATVLREITSPTKAGSDVRAPEPASRCGDVRPGPTSSVSTVAAKPTRSGLRSLYLHTLFSSFGWREGGGSVAAIIIIPFRELRENQKNLAAIDAVLG